MLQQQRHVCRSIPFFEEEGNNGNNTSHSICFPDNNSSLTFHPHTHAAAHIVRIQGLAKLQRVKNVPTLKLADDISSKT